MKEDQSLPGMPEPAVKVTPEQTYVHPVDPFAGVFADIRDEMVKQDEKWGEQNHPMHGGKVPERGRISHDGQADTWKAINDSRASVDQIGWDGILLEESFEAAGAATVEDQIKELVQVAAVAVQAIRALKRQAGA